MFTKSLQLRKKIGRLKNNIQPIKAKRGLVSYVFLLFDKFCFLHKQLWSPMKTLVVTYDRGSLYSLSKILRFSIKRISGKENRIYIRVEFTRKKCKTAILLYWFHTAGVLHIFMLYYLLSRETLFYRKSNINIQRKPNYEIGWFHNWPMIISHRLNAFPFTKDDFPL